MKKFYYRWLLAPCMVFISFLAGAKELRTDSLCADFDLLISYLSETHPDPFTAFGGENKFYAAADSIKCSILRDSISTTEEFTDICHKFLCRLHDGHTTMYSSIENGPARRLPILFRQVADGLVVRGIDQLYKDALGLKLIGVNGHDLNILKDKLSLLVTAENESGKILNIRSFINNERYLRRLIDNLDGDSVSINLQKDDGELLSVTVPFMNQNDWMNLEYAFLPSALTLPKDNFGFGFVDKDGKTGYFRIRSLMSRDNFDFMKQNGWDYEDQLRDVYASLRRNMPENPDSAIAALPVVAEAFGEALKQMRNKKSQNLIIDLRGNGGGWTPIVFPMLYEMFGKEMIGVDSDVKFVRKLSPLFLAKINMTLDEFNKSNGGAWEMGDMIHMQDEEADTDMDAAQLEQYIRNVFMTSSPEILLAQNGKPIYKPENIFVITDGDTFSAAFHTAFYLWKLGAKIVGVASSQSPNTYMETTEFTLPRTGISGSISNSIQMFLPADDKNAHQFEPDIPLTLKDFHRLNNDNNAEVILIQELTSKQ